MSSVKHGLISSGSLNRQCLTYLIGLGGVGGVLGLYRIEYHKAEL